MNSSPNKGTYLFLTKIPELILHPIRCCPVFFCFVIILGFIYITMYQNSMFVKSKMLFIDTYLVCAVISAFPAKVQKILLTICYVGFYTLLFTDFFLYGHFNVNINPSVLLVINESNWRETTEFVSVSVLTLKTAKLLIILCLVVILNIIISNYYSKINIRINNRFKAICAYFLLALLISFSNWFIKNKIELFNALKTKTVNDLERINDYPPEAVCDVRLQTYCPIYELIYSVHGFRLILNELDVLKSSINDISIDSCSFRCPTIVWIIGESLNKHHTSVYGYQLATTPKQKMLIDSGNIIQFNDVVTSHGYTSYVFKNMFSLYSIGQEGGWTNYPLFPSIMKQAGYSISFISNQFAKKLHSNFFDVSGDFFLNDSIIDASLFDFRNGRTTQYDESLIDIYKDRPSAYYKFDIFHFLGQHFDYSMRYPKHIAKFSKTDYNYRTDLQDNEKEILADYDNSVYYNDSVIYEILRMYDKQDAIAIIHSDHGETVYDNCHQYMDRSNIDNVNEIPFLIYVSDTFMQNHPDITDLIRKSANKPFMIDDLPHLFLYLSGIQTPWYNDKRNLLSPDFDSSRLRTINGSVNYDVYKKH